MVCGSPYMLILVSRHMSVSFDGMLKECSPFQRPQVALRLWSISGVIAHVCEVQSIFATPGA